MLQGFDTAAFLRDHWQRKPLLIRNPWAQWRNPIAPDELAGLACEEAVESRLVRHAGGLEVEPGPFAPARFGKVGKQPWTLLVQSVDHHDAAVGALLDAFRFVPNWRVDDVMVSYAVDGGGVGPHFDQYDVFLVQGLGRRRWQIGGWCDSDTALQPHDELRLLADFVPTEEWVLEPGDILYLPPGLAHNGVAIGDDCMTYSIGFRAPSRRELIEGWSEHMAAGLLDEDRFADPRIAAQPNPGEISGAAIDRLHALVLDALSDRAAFARWFGEFSSTPKHDDAGWELEEPIAADDLHRLLDDGAPLVRNPSSRFSFVRTGADGLTLFADGRCFACTGAQMAFAEDLCSHAAPVLDPMAAAADEVAELIAALIEQGSIGFEEDDG